ncbi:TPA: STY1053 family phage-associated protein [Raoultella planticola]
MKYLVTSGAVLRFTDGSQVDLTPGVHSFEKHVTEHWAFGAHARAIDEDELKQNQGGEDLSLKITELESTITGLQQQVDEKDSTITGLQQQLDELTGKLASQEAGNAKKQPSTNK